METTTKTFYIPVSLSQEEITTILRKFSLTVNVPYVLHL